MVKKKKMLFIPADVIKNEVSRSFFFAKNLSKYYDLYFLERLDPQNAYFENRKQSKAFTFKCFLFNIFCFIKLNKHPKWDYHTIRSPFLSHMVIHRIIGMVPALKMSRAFNKIYLRKIAKRIKPDIIFHADGFDLYPSLSGYSYVGDIQDDFDNGNFRDNNYNIAYTREKLQGSKVNFVVSRRAAENLSRSYGCSFEYVPNGVDVEEMSQIDPSKIDNYRKKYALENKFVISYIGADAWYDKNLVKRILDLAWKADHSIHFLIVGNLPAIKSPNATFVGPVSKYDSYHFYHLSNSGILLKDSKGSNFLHNSIPLKIIQYGVINKWFISPPIAWLEEEKFNNIKLLKEFTAEIIVRQILDLKNIPADTSDNSWNDYDWANISEGLYQHINKNTKF